MIKNPEILRKFKNDLIRREKPDYKKNMKIFEEMHKHAVKILKDRPPRDPLEGIETIIKVAKFVNSV